MSKEQKLINKIKRRERWVKESKKARYKVDKSQETMQASPRAYKLMRKPQRRMDSSFGYDTVANEPYLEYKMVAASLTRFDFDPGAGTDFGLKLTLPAVIAGDVAEVSTVTTVADVAGSLNDTYFLFDSPSTDYYVWYDVAAGGTDPLIPGRTGVHVSIASGATAAQVATATAAAVNALALFNAGAVGALVTITGQAYGNTPDLTDGAVPTGFSFAVTTQGSESATGTFHEEVGFEVGDLVVIEQEDSQVENRMLEIVAIVDDHTVRLDDVATFAGTETDVTVRFIISGVKKSYV